MGFKTRAALWTRHRRKCGSRTSDHRCIGSGDPLRRGSTPQARCDDRPADSVAGRAHPHAATGCGTQRAWSSLPGTRRSRSTRKTFRPEHYSRTRSRTSGPPPSKPSCVRQGRGTNSTSSLTERTRRFLPCRWPIGCSICPRQLSPRTCAQSGSSSRPATSQTTRRQRPFAKRRPAGSAPDRYAEDALHTHGRQHVDT